MRIGGGGSTGEAIQHVRGLPLLQQTRRNLSRPVHPKAVRLVHLGERAVPEETLQPIQAFALFYRLVFLPAGTALVAVRLDLASGAGQIRRVVPSRIRRISPVVAGRTTVTT